MEKLIFNLHSPEVPVMETRETTCLLCGGGESTEVNRFQFNGVLFRTVRCTRDNMMYMQPQPTPAFYNQLYQTKYHGDSDDSLREQLTDEIGDNPERRESDARIRLDEIEKFKQQGSLLELGCGPGFVLKEARKRGWKVAGVEASPHYKAVTNQEGLSVYFGNFLEFDSKGEKFDAIALYSVLEHLSDPKTYLEKIKQLLKKDGIIILRVPNTPPAGTQVSLLVHLQHFTEQTITEFLKMNGFQVQMMNTDAGVYKSARYNTELPNMNIIANQSDSDTATNP